MTYSGKILHTSGGSMVQFMLIFTYLDADGNVIIFDYISATIDPAISLEYEYSFTYDDPLGYEV